MSNLINTSKTLVCTVALAAGMTGLAFAQNYNSSATNSDANSSQNSNYNNNGHSRSMVREAQQQLQNDGYYSGNIDGEDGPMTHQAIRKYQKAENLTVNGRLDKQTCDKLGLQGNNQ